MQTKLTRWEDGHAAEVAQLRRDLELTRLGETRGASAMEAERAFMLIAALWHAAGSLSCCRFACAGAASGQCTCADPSSTGRCAFCVAASEQARTTCVEKALNACRIYFHRDRGGDAESPLLLPMSALVLEPLRIVVGPRAVECLGLASVPRALAVNNSAGASARATRTEAAAGAGAVHCTGACAPL